MTFANKPVTLKQVRATIALLKWYRAFLASDCEQAHVPGDWTKRRMDKREARRRLYSMIEVAINRKAGIPDETYAEQQQRHDWEADQRALADIRRRIRVYQFRTSEVREQFGHLLSRHDD